MYSARITSSHPTAFIFLIDQSGSMEERMSFGTSLTTKAEVVAMVTNMLIRELINRCRKEEGVVDYFDIAAIGYSGERATALTAARGIAGGARGSFDVASTGGREALSCDGRSAFTKPSALMVADCRRRTFTRERLLPDGNISLTSDQLCYWIEPGAEGNTPMRSALEQALLLTSRWCRQARNRDSYPPTIFNITDGEATDGDHESLTAIAHEIKSQGTRDGGALLINIDISSTFCDHTILFPGSSAELPGCRYAQTLFEMSSTMPEVYNDAILAIRPHRRPPFRGMSFNTSAADLITMINIGSRSISKII